MSIKRNIKDWYKFAFKLLVNDQWHVIADRVENGDQSYRWVKEQLILSLRGIEREGWQKRLGAAAFNIKQRIESFKNSLISDEDYLRAQHWLKGPGGKFVLQDESCSVVHRLLGAKLALLESLLVNYDDAINSGREISDVFKEIVDIQAVVNAIYENEDAKLAYEVKVMYDLVKEYAKTNNIPLDNLIELEFKPACLPSEIPSLFIPTETWVFGDYGYEDGQLHSPDKVQVDKEGNYLVMDQDITGENVPQRIQLFGPTGRFIKVILRREDGIVNGMRDFCLNKSGNIVVVDTDGQDRARIQIFDYDSNLLMVIKVDEDNPDSYPRVLNIFVDEDDHMICADMGLSCVWVYSPDGKVKARFGEWGRSDGSFFGLSSVAVNDNKIYAFSNGENCVKTQIFDYNGTLIKTVWPGYIYLQVVFHTDGQIYAVTDNCIDKLDQEGNHVVVAGKVDGYGSSLDDFFHLSSMVFLSDGRVAVSESGNHRIKVFKL